MYIVTLLAQVVRFTAHFLQLILFASPAHLPSAAFGLWAARLIALALLARTYIAPWAVRLITDRIRVRSVSLRSIRGLYFRAGSRTLTVDRIGLTWRWLWNARSLRVGIKVEGLVLQIEQDERRVKKRSSIIINAKGKTEQVEVPPNDAASFVHSLLSFFASYVEDLPIWRSLLLLGSRIVIQALPTLTHSLDFELDSAVLAFPHTSGAQVQIKGANLQTVLEVEEPSHQMPLSGQTSSAQYSRFFHWRRRAGRTWDRAWGGTQCTGSVSLHIGSISSTAPRRGLVVSSLVHDTCSNFLDLPEGLDFGASVRFKPQTGEIEPQSVQISLALGVLDMDVDIIQKILRDIRGPSMPVPTDLGMEDLPGPTSPVSPSLVPFPATPVSPAGPRPDPWSVLRLYNRPVAIQRLKRHKQSSALSILNSIRLTVSTFNITHTSSRAVLQGTLQRLNFCAKVSTPDAGTLHRQWLGKASPMDGFPADSYALALSVASCSVSGRADCRDDWIRVTYLDEIVSDVLISQWPTPWLAPSPILAGDPDAKLFVMQIQIGDIEVDDRLADFTAARRSQPQRADIAAQTSPSSVISPVPRTIFDIRIRSITGRLASDSARTSVLELRNGGFFASASSQFTLVGPPGFRKEKWTPSATHIPLYMLYTLSATFQPTFIRLVDGGASTQSNITVLGEDPTPIKDESLLSMDSVEFSLDGSVRGQVEDNLESRVELDLASAFSDAICSMDALSVELWHPDVINAVAALISRFTPEDDATGKEPQRGRLLDRLPAGVTARFAIARMTVFVTHPDINPEDDNEFSRGVAMRTGITLAYCSMRQQHVGSTRELQTRWQRRNQLYLSEERLVEATSAANAFAITQRHCALAQITLRDLTIRSAISTSIIADDPYCELSDVDVWRDFFQVRYAKADFSLYGQRKNGAAAAGTIDKCLITVEVPSIQFHLRVVHVHSLLLANQTIERLRPARRSATVPKGKTVDWIFEVQIDTLQGRLQFPLDEEVCVRLSHMKVDPGTIFMENLFIWVPTHRKTIVYDAEETPWEELARFQHINIGVRTSPTSVTIEGDSVRLRVPHQYVLARLIKDVSLSLKCVRHLNKIVDAGQYSAFPPPEPEQAKIVPQISARLRSFAFEMADDPFESDLASAWQAGLAAAAVRHERDEAFEAKVASIQVAEDSQPSRTRAARGDYHFDAKRSIPIAEAQMRLYHLHSIDWLSRHRETRDKKIRREHLTFRYIWGSEAAQTTSDSPILVLISPLDDSPPLLRATFRDMAISISSLGHSAHQLSDYLHIHGKGLPQDTRFSLLVPLKVALATASARIAIRDYPLPVLNVPAHSNVDIPGLEFKSDLVIAEEMGDHETVEWISCTVVKAHTGVRGARSFVLRIPKTIMPVKTYANPLVQVNTANVTDFSWAVSYGPAIQDIMRVMDTITSPPEDPSDPLGFWDKLRLQLHWRVQIQFSGPVHLNMKGLRDPHELTGSGAGFVLCLQGAPSIAIGYDSQSKELVRITGETMVVAIPDYEHSDSRSVFGDSSSRQFHKVCAKFSSGVRLGFGFVLERTCNVNCDHCEGSQFHRRCRYFDFIPHYAVKLRTKGQPNSEDLHDSYSGFRSDYIHMSISLESSTSQSSNLGSIFHLTPRLFTHFWSWWSLFDRTLALGIRQGPLYPRKIVSPKFGQHLATIKYRIVVPRLFITHVYFDDSQEAWADGVTPRLGVKARIGHFRADLHQREEESTVAGELVEATRVVRHKPFYEAEVVLKDMDLRALLAIFPEPLKQTVELDGSPESSSYRKREDLPTLDSQSDWFDIDDLTEVDWTPSSSPTRIHLLPAMLCPHFTYFKRDRQKDRHEEQAATFSKFGAEDTHVCFLGKEATVSQVQIEMVQARIKELQKKHHQKSNRMAGATEDGAQSTDESNMITLLEDYIRQLRSNEAATAANAGEDGHSYYMPSDSVIPSEWAQFDNVYQVHSPQVFMSNAIRDMMMQYYHFSRSRKGFEYHMATRAVKFIRDQAEATLAVLQTRGKKRLPAAAHNAAQALRKMLAPEHGPRMSVLVSDNVAGIKTGIEPLSGWSDGVSLEKSHFCLLLKPQVVLRSEVNKDSVCILAAVHAKLQSFAIMDMANVGDPVASKIMLRIYTSLSGLQTFAPSSISVPGNGCVPLEVLVDLRCETSDFDRLVPQTDATFRYDRFNRLRLRNEVTSVMASADDVHAHLHHQTDLITVAVPRFTVSASDRHFQAISDIVSNLVLHQDAAHKKRVEKLETLLFRYDFTDLASAANVISDLQARLRRAVGAMQNARSQLSQSGDPGQSELLQLRAEVLSVAEELNLIFDAIKLAQDKVDDRNDQKSALLLRTSSTEISWRMLDDNRDLLAKLAVRNIDYTWLSRQDSSTRNKLRVGDMQAFAGSAQALWPEILSKHDEPASHPLVKRGIFVMADWTVLAPVGGIAIYQEFELTLHPMRLQVDTRIGKRIMEYVWPARKKRNESTQPSNDEMNYDIAPSSRPVRSRRTTELPADKPGPGRISLDLQRHQRPGLALEDGPSSRSPSFRKLPSSRSFNDLRSVARQGTLDTHITAGTDVLKPDQSERMQRNFSFASQASQSNDYGYDADSSDNRTTRISTVQKGHGDAEEMKSRSSQKHFALVRVGSLHLLLSIAKEQSFLCNDARIQTRSLEYRNQTWSLEEMVDQFIPSDPSWKGWVKMALHQPLVPVLPVARELISKTKWIASKGGHILDVHGQPKLLKDTVRAESTVSARSGSLTPRPLNASSESYTADAQQSTPSSSNNQVTESSHREKRFRLFQRPSTPSSRRSHEADDIASRSSMQLPPS